jgi:hypothetical protein
MLRTTIALSTLAAAALLSFPAAGKPRGASGLIEGQWNYTGTGKVYQDDLDADALETKNEIRHAKFGGTVSLTDDSAAYTGNVTLGTQIEYSFKVGSTTTPVTVAISASGKRQGSAVSLATADGTFTFAGVATFKKLKLGDVFIPIPTSLKGTGALRRDPEKEIVLFSLTLKPITF